MKKHNRKFRRSGTGNQLPIKHNQKKPFNPGKYGKLWGGIEWDCEWGRQPVGDATGPVIGKLHIGGKQFELTWTECTKIIQTLADAQRQAKVGRSLGYGSKMDGTWKGYKN